MNEGASATGWRDLLCHVVPGRTVQDFAMACKYAGCGVAKSVTQPVASQASTDAGQRADLYRLEQRL